MQTARWNEPGALNHHLEESSPLNWEQPPGSIMGREHELLSMSPKNLGCIYCSSW